MYSVDTPGAALKLSNSLAPWTSSPDIITALAPQYDATLSVLRDFHTSVPAEIESATRRTRLQTENMEKDDMRLALEETLASLAEMLCKICLERVTWCRALAEDEQDKASAEEIWKQYLVKRGDWIKPLGITYASFLLLILATFGLSDKALDIAEIYRDYKSLVELCLEPRDDDGHRNQRVHERLEYYLMHYGEEFAFTLYNFYLQNRTVQSDIVDNRNVCRITSRISSRKGFSVEISTTTEIRETKMDSRTFTDTVSRRRSYSPRNCLPRATSPPQKALSQYRKIIPSCHRAHTN